MANNMEAIASCHQLKPWVQELVNNPEWMDGFDEHIGRLNKVLILTVPRLDKKLVDVVGITSKEALRPFGLHESFLDRPCPEHNLYGPLAMSIMLRAVMMPHEPELSRIGRSPLDMEVDYADFIQAARGSNNFVTKSYIHQRHTRKFGEQIVAFLAKGIRPLIV